MDPPSKIRLLIVLDRPVAAYSGMVPGFVAGDYQRGELEIDVVPLARRANAGVILCAAHSIDPIQKKISIEGRPAIRYDLASIDVGSTVRGLELPGVTKHTLATRPIGHFVREIDQKLDAFADLDRPMRILVVGGGAAGTELAFTIDARLRRSGLEPSLAIISGDDELLAGTSARTRRAIRREAENRGIESIFAKRVLRADPSGVVVGPAEPDSRDQGSTHLPADLVVWATGAAPTPFPVSSDNEDAQRFSRDAAGFLEVRDTLQTVGFDDVFAVGDCARLVDHRWIPRAGVYAVRQGPILERNLRAHLDGRPLTRYRPQRDFLSLLYLGQGRALASKWGAAFAGPSLFRLKDWIDRRFMVLFQVLDESGSPRPALEKLGAMSSGGHGEEGGGEGEDEMACGGCAAKLGAEPLMTALARLPAARPDDTVLLGLDARDDVAATQDESGRTTLHNIDVIRSFCDDPWLLGRVAASNALSDLFAKGGRPRYAQAVIGLPDGEAEQAQELLFQILSGIRATLDEHGVSLLGGHTTIGEELTAGLSVSGDGPESGRLLRQSGAQDGDDLLFTGRLGTGVVLAADHMGLAKGVWVASCHTAMQDTNEIGGRLALELGAHASTDVTGFGFAGHLMTLLDQTSLIAEIDRASMPFLPGAEALWAAGHRSTADPANREAFRRHVRGASVADEAWLFDPQTSGGLLLAVAADKTPAMVEAFTAAGEPRPTKIGRLESLGRPDTNRPDHRIEILEAKPNP
jgi:selenide,water dikinase